jgi:16S rRNA (cytidine1402-2'-O)-methyltransferase
VQSVPGPTALTAALAVSGLPTDRFVFEGFLPRRGGARSARLEQLAAETRTMVFYESVHRMADTAQALIEAFGPQRAVTVARELTKLHEQTFSGSLADLAAGLGESIPLLGEFVIVVAGNDQEVTVDEAAVQRVFGVLRRELPPGKAAALTAELTGLPRNQVYRLTRVEG